MCKQNISNITWWEDEINNNIENFQEITINRECLIYIIKKVTNKYTEKLKKDLYKIVDNQKRYLDGITEHEYIDTCEIYKFLSKM